MHKRFRKSHKTILLFLLVITSFYMYAVREDIVVAFKDTFGVKPQQYYGVTVDMSQILPESDHYIIDEDGNDLIDLSQELGINSFRITNISSISKDKETSSYTHEQWEKVLGKMYRKGIYATILAEANNTDTKFHSQTLELDENYLNFIKQYVIDSKVCNFSNVYAVDIRNEPLLNEHNLQKLREASQLVKTACPDTLITVGSWRTYGGKKQENGEPEYNWHDPKETAKLDDIVDIHSAHIYGFDKKTKNGTYPDPYELTVSYLNEIRKYSNKPILIEEFGAGNGLAISDQNTLGSEELQTNVYAGVLKATYDQRNREVIGTLAYLLHPRTTGAESWNIVSNNGARILPAAHIFKYYTSQSSHVSEPQPQPMKVPDSIIVGNKQNGQTITAFTNDLIALNLVIPETKYKVTLSDAETLTTIQDIQHSGKDKYYTVFKATSPGTTNVEIKKMLPCTDPINCEEQAETIYKLTISVEEKPL